MTSPTDVYVGVAVGLAAAYVVLPAAVSTLKWGVRQLKFFHDRRAFPALRRTKRGAIEDGWRRAMLWVAKDPPSRADVQAFTTKSLAQLVTALHDGQVTATKLLRIFYTSAKEAHDRCNCVVHVFVEDAIASAERADTLLDAARSSTQRAAALAALPPLLGLPISIKDSTDVQGADSTCGLFGRCLRPAARDATLVAQLRAAGAVFHVKTNIPALLMSHECENDVFGTCVNPVLPGFTCGGSSGGEGALIRLGGSVAGIGSDVGGSIRIPSHFCGIVGLKPSVNRVAYRGCCPEQGDEGVAPVSGPMGRSVADVVALFRVLAPPVPFGSDGMQFNVPFIEERFNAARRNPSLNLLFYREDGFVQVSPACRRGVDIAVTALRAAGHRVTEWQPKLTEDVQSIFFELFAADKCRSLAEELGSDRPIGVVGPALQLAAFPDRLKFMLGFFMGAMIDPVYGKLLTRLKERRIDAYFTLLMERNRLRHQYAEVFAGTVDAIIGPGFTTPAPPCGSTTEQPYGAVVTAVYNALDLSVVAVPVTTVDATLDEWTEAHLQTAKNQGMSRSIAAAYDAKAMHGLPIGVQVITPRMTEETALGVAMQLEEALAKRRATA